MTNAYAAVAACFMSVWGLYWFWSTLTRKSITSVCLFVSPLCLHAFALSCVCVDYPLSMFQWWRGYILWLRSYLVSDTSGGSVFFLNSSSSVTFSSLCHNCIFTMIFFCGSALYTQHPFHVCLSWERNPSSAALPGVSSIFYPLKGLFKESFSSFELSVSGQRVLYSVKIVNPPEASCDLWYWAIYCK